MNQKLDWKIISVGLGILLLLISLFVYSGILLFSPDKTAPTDSSHSTTGETEEEGHVHLGEDGLPIEEIAGTDSEEQHEDMKYEEIYKSNLSETHSIKFFNRLTFSPTTLVEGVSLPDTQSTLMDIYKEDFLFKAEPDFLYWYDASAGKQLVLDEGVNLAAFDQTSGTIYYTKSYLIYEKVFQYDTLTNERMELYQIPTFKATSLLVKENVAMVSGYQYVANQAPEKRRYYSVFVPNFSKKGIFRKDPFTLPSTNHQPFFSYDNDVYVISFQGKNSTFNIHTAPIQPEGTFRLISSKKTSTLPKELVSSESKLVALNNRIALYHEDMFMVNGTTVPFTQPIKKMDFLDEDHLLILGESLELHIYSIAQNEFVLLKNDVFGYHLHQQTLHIQTMFGELMHATYETK